jgi:hypothetical protein
MHMHACLQDPEIAEELEAYTSLGICLALERSKGRASHLFPLMQLLPATPEALWWHPTNEAAGIAKIAADAGAGLKCNPANYLSCPHEHQCWVLNEALHAHAVSQRTEY